ncbi:MAG: DUF72 domain-containing protein [Myxococcota bacterium]
MRRDGQDPHSSGARGVLRVGTSGWHYDHWRGVLYPHDLPRARWFECYTRHFGCVEIDNTFYRLPSVETFESWRDRAPRGFRYALKFSRYGTHLRKLKDPAGSLGHFLAGAERLGARLGPILVQLPPRWRADPERLDAFLAAAPRRHRWAVELRDPSWLSDAVFDVLRAHRAALVLHDLLPRHPRVRTADWIYLRYHGTAGLYSGGYGPRQLAGEARRIAAWLEHGIDVWAFFNNDQAGHAVHDATALRERVEDRLCREARG